MSVVLRSVEGRVGVLTLNRPSVLNAWTLEMAAGIVDLLRDFDRDDNIRAVVMTGAGRAFCAGADLAIAGASTFDINVTKRGQGVIRGPADHRDEGGVLSLAMLKFSKPLICAINGHAAGVGITMSLAADIRIVSEDAKIGFVFSRRGIVPEACSTYLLPRLIGPAKAYELIFRGSVFRAGDAERTPPGLFNYVLPQNQVLPRAMEMAHEIAESTSAVSVCLAKSMLQESIMDPSATVESQHLLESKAMEWIGRQPDSMEGVSSFLEKRKPEFTMRASTDLPDFYPWRRAINTDPGASKL